MHDAATGEVAGLGWLSGWRRTAAGWRLETVVERDGQWASSLAQPSLLLDQPRVFEPSSPPLASLRTESVRIRIDDLSRLPSLMRPGNLVGRWFPQARCACQAIFVSKYEGTAAYIPAGLLVRELWLWCGPALPALLLPNVLELFLSTVEGANGLVVRAAGPLARLGTGDTSLRRLSWLAQCPDARDSWSSVLSSAHGGAINLRLPRASMQAWGWGVELAHGILCAELSSVTLGFELPVEGVQMQLGQRTLRCPPAPVKRTGLVTF